jgi:hypothetical protein
MSFSVRFENAKVDGGECEMYAPFTRVADYDDDDLVPKRVVCFGNRTLDEISLRNVNDQVEIIRWANGIAKFIGSDFLQETDEFYRITTCFTIEYLEKLLFILRSTVSTFVPTKDVVYHCGVPYHKMVSRVSIPVLEVNWIGACNAIVPVVSVSPILIAIIARTRPQRVIAPFDLGGEILAACKSLGTNCLSYSVLPLPGQREFREFGELNQSSTLRDLYMIRDDFVHAMAADLPIELKNVQSRYYDTIFLDVPKSYSVSWAVSALVQSHPAFLELKEVVEVRVVTEDLLKADIEMVDCLVAVPFTWGIEQTYASDGKLAIVVAGKEKGAERCLVSAPLQDEGEPANLIVNAVRRDYEVLTTNTAYHDLVYACSVEATNRDIAAVIVHWVCMVDPHANFFASPCSCGGGLHSRCIPGVIARCGCGYQTNDGSCQCVHCGNSMVSLWEKAGSDFAVALPVHRTVSFAKVQQMNRKELYEFLQLPDVVNTMRTDQPFRDRVMAIAWKMNLLTPVSRGKLNEMRKLGRRRVRRTRYQWGELMDPPTSDWVFGYRKRPEWKLKIDGIEFLREDGNR